MKHWSFPFVIVGAATMVLKNLISESPHYLHQFSFPVQNWSSLLDATAVKARTTITTTNETFHQEPYQSYSSSRETTNNNNHHPTNNASDTQVSSSSVVFNAHVQVYVVIHPWNEMGNWLFLSVMGKCLQLKLRDDYGIDSHLILQHPPHMSAGMHQAQTTLQHCFPFYKNLKKRSSDYDDDDDDDDDESTYYDYDIQIREPARLIERKFQDIQQKVTKANDTTIINVHCHSFFVPNSWMDHYFDTLREYFVMNQSKCCHPANNNNSNNNNSSIVMPQPTEHVYHFRNFGHEMFRKGKNYTDYGWHELSPRQAAVDLFGYLKNNNNNNNKNKTNNNGRKDTSNNTTPTSTTTGSPPSSSSSSSSHPMITVVSRFESAESMAQVLALQREGFDARIIPHYNPPLPSAAASPPPHASQMSALHDFCFLMQAQGDIAGMARSTFYRFTSLFGRSHRSWWIVVDTPQQRNMLGEEWYTFQHDYHWTHPVLQGRIQHRIFLPEEKDTDKNI
jgi:hypothetical protein